MRAEPGSASPACLRVLLLEDDPAIQRFVALVAQDCGVEVQAVHSLAAADQALNAAGFDLLLADLMLPDGSAVEWLQGMRQADPARYPRRVVAFSAGLGATVRHALALAGVDHFLPKPVSVDDLEACFKVKARRGAAIEQAGVSGMPCVGCDQAPATASAPAARQRKGVVRRYFGGDAQLHADFLRTWQGGLAAEIVRAEHHLAASDLAALARIAHSMKSALRMLGQQRLAQDASLVEQRCAQRADAGAALAWARLRAGLQGWMARPGDDAEPA